ncbi:MAG: hypothetical protein OCD00_09060 [Colwellia sp.]
MNCMQSVELIHSFTTFPVSQTKKGSAKEEALDEYFNLTVPAAQWLLFFIFKNFTHFKQR